MRAAAIVVPLISTAAGTEVLFTVRAASLRHHPGQIAFPGGHVDEGESHAQAAVRELAEETGLTLGSGRILGELDAQPSPAGVCAVPHVAHVEWPQPLRLQHAEVAEVFTIPLQDLLDTTPDVTEVSMPGFRRTLHSYKLHGRDIWGLTGNVVHNFLGLVRAAVAGAEQPA